MTLRSLFDAWNGFFFAQQSPMPIALFRVVYGLLVIATLILLRPDWLAWYGVRGWVSLATVRKLEPGMRLDLFTVLPQRNTWIEALFWVFLGSAILLTIGFLTRLNSVLVFLCLTSMHQRNLYITHGGDTFLRVAGFFLMWAPAGAALSVDRLMRIWRGKEGADTQPHSPCAQRMIQFELALVYFAGFCSKMQGAPWIQGTALYYVYHIDELQRFPVPDWLLYPLVLKLGSWSTLVLEFSLGVLIWVRDLRYILLTLGLLFHLCLEYSLNIPLFQWDILSAYVLFIDPADLAFAWNRIRGRIAMHLGEPVRVFYDGGSEQPRRIVDVLRAIDIFHRLSFADLRASQTRFGVPTEREGKGLLVATRSGIRHGFAGVQELAGVVPLLWPLALPTVFRRLWPFGVRRAVP